MTVVDLHQLRAPHFQNVRVVERPVEVGMVQLRDAVRLVDRVNIGLNGTHDIVAVNRLDDP
jgi:hypothetical protein